MNASRRVVQGKFRWTLTDHAIDRMQSRFYPAASREQVSQLLLSRSADSAIIGYRNDGKPVYAHPDAPMIGYVVSMESPSGFPSVVTVMEILPGTGYKFLAPRPPPEQSLDSIAATARSPFHYRMKELQEKLASRDEKIEKLQRELESQTKAALDRDIRRKESEMRHSLRIHQKAEWMNRFYRGVLHAIATGNERVLELVKECYLDVTDFQQAVLTHDGKHLRMDKEPEFSDESAEPIGPACIRADGTCDRSCSGLEGHAAGSRLFGSPACVRDPQE